MIDAQGKLPLKPSELLRLAAEDVRKVINNPKLTVNMDDWARSPDSETQACTVCLAGAVMIGTLDATISCGLRPTDFGGDCDALLALDAARCGQWYIFVDKLNDARMEAGIPLLTSRLWREWRIFNDEPTQVYSGLLSAHKQAELACDLDRWAAIWERDRY